MSTRANLQTWPEPVIPVQTLSDMRTIPTQYIKQLEHRPDPQPEIPDISIPVLSLSDILSGDPTARDEVNSACREWGFFQLVEHGVRSELMSGALETWREFFELPMEVKQLHANSPETYEGYGSRVGVEKGALLDWCDYFFLHFYPQSVRDPGKWPSLPSSCRAVTEEYGEALVELGGKLLKVFSDNLGLPEGRLVEAFGEKSACLRVNFYPKCQQPDLTLGVSPHSDPGGITLLLADQNVAGLQVRHRETWVTVKPLPGAFIVNLGDQIEILSNGIYKSVEHRATVSSEFDRISLAFFYNPQGEIPIKPIKELTVNQQQSALYPSMTFNEYRAFIRREGLRGKDQVKSLKLKK